MPFTLTATPSITEGLYYTLSTANNATTPGNSVYDGHFFTAEGADNDLMHVTSTGTQSSGTIYLLSGTLVNTNGTAIIGAVIELWEADNNGIYWYNLADDKTDPGSSKYSLGQGNVVQCRAELGLCLTRTGQAAEGEALLRAALMDGAQSDRNDFDHTFGSLETALGECLLAQRRYAEAQNHRC